MGNRGPKPKFVEITCPNDSCGNLGQTGLGNIIGNGTYQTKSGTVESTSVTPVARYFVIELIPLFLI